MFARNRVALLLAVSALLLIAGCASGGTTPEAPPASPPAQDGATTDGAASGDGAALVESKCTMCHSLDRVNGAVKDGAAWESTVNRMESNGLVVTPEEKQAIVDYLTERDASR